MCDNIKIEPTDKETTTPPEELEQSVASDHAADEA